MQGLVMCLVWEVGERGVAPLAVPELNLSPPGEAWVDGGVGDGDTDVKNWATGPVGHPRRDVQEALHRSLPAREVQLRGRDTKPLK